MAKKAEVEVTVMPAPDQTSEAHRRAVALGMKFGQIIAGMQLLDLRIAKAVGAIPAQMVRMRTLNKAPTMTLNDIDEAVQGFIGSIETVIDLHDQRLRMNRSLQDKVVASRDKAKLQRTIDEDVEAIARYKMLLEQSRRENPVPQLRETERQLQVASRGEIPCANALFKTARPINAAGHACRAGKQPRARAGKTPRAPPPML